MYIYKIINKINGKMYIGKTTKTIESRFKKHIEDAFIGKRKTKICNALRKYGKDNFIIEEICQCSSKEELNEKEIYYIALYKTQELGYNISKGGDGGITPYHTNEKQISLFKARKGKTYEEIYGEEKAKEIKEYMHKCMSGKNSPSYKNIDMISLFKELKENPFIKIDILAKKYKLSRVTMAKKIKDILNIDNIQKYRYNKSEVELKKIFGEIYDKMVFGKLEN